MGGMAIEQCLGGSMTDVRHRSKASGSFAGSRLVKDPVIRKAAFRFQCPRCGRCA